jgi:hypothetical protein
MNTYGKQGEGYPVMVNQKSDEDFCPEEHRNEGPSGCGSAQAAPTEHPAPLSGEIRHSRHNAVFLFPTGINLRRAGYMLIDDEYWSRRSGPFKPPFTGDPRIAGFAAALELAC